MELKISILDTRRIVCVYFIDESRSIVIPIDSLSRDNLELSIILHKKSIDFLETEFLSGGDNVEHSSMSTS